MKLPSFRELSKEQDRIYNLPLSNNYLISGPPGTGKTVIALYRASMYKEQKKTPVMLSYSKLLSNYTGDAAKELKIHSLVQTYHSWVFHTYRKYFGQAPPQKAKWIYDWPAIVPKLYDAVKNDRPYLLIDEGQDLPPDFYLAALLLANNVTVFADENQRITETQSTFADIIKNACIRHEHKLTRNYRNSLEIARVAACFYAGLPTGKPELPERKGPLPVVQNTKGFNDVIELISRFERNNSHMQIGVFTKYLDSQNDIFESLQGKTKNQVEYYDYRDSEMPSFGIPGIKLINFMSAKGLEFDAVFIPEIQNLNMDMGNLESKMLFYVLLSRAREQLYLLYSGVGKPKIFDLIPKEFVQYKKS